MNELKGKVAVVTGSSKGIGACIAEHLAAEGATVAVNYVSSKNGADAVVARIYQKGGKAIAIQGNVSKPEDIQRLFSEIKKELGRVDVLVNNAGTYEFAPLESITPEHIEMLHEGESREQQEKTTPLGRIATPEDIAIAATFLAGDDARWITGQVIVAGGKRM